MSKYKPRFLQSPFCTKRAEVLRQQLNCWYLKRHPLNRWAFKAHTHRHVLRAESKAAHVHESVALRLQPQIRIQKSKYRYATRTYVVYRQSAWCIDKFPDPDPHSSKMTDGKKISWVLHFLTKLSPVTALLRSKARSEPNQTGVKKTWHYCVNHAGKLHTACDIDL